MKKVDYSHLAQCVKIAMRDDKARAVVAQLARDFARVASVDRAAFLKACGID
jgi:hypothetical protein